MTRPKQNHCKQCGRPIPPRYRKCDDCIIGGPAQSMARREKPVGISSDGALLVRTERDVVLSCGHVVATKVRLGDQVRCPLHRRIERATRVHDGYEVPEVQR